MNEAIIGVIMFTIQLLNAFYVQHILAVVGTIYIVYKLGKLTEKLTIQAFNKGIKKSR